jgi:cytochrome c biogenesis protein
LPIEKHSLWSFFSSVKLTIILLVLIVLLFIAGTFIPSPDVVQTFANQLSPGAGKIFLFFRLSDLYHSSLFYILLTLLSLNLIICSVNRFPALWKQYKAPHFPKPDGIFDNLPQSRIIRVDKEISKIKPIVKSCLKKNYSHISEIEEKRGHFFYAQRGRFSLFGVYIVHLSILIMIAGAIIGSIFGLEADINIKEGESVNVANLTKSNGLYKLDFSVRCDKFTVEFYKDGTPKTYRSDLSFIKNGKVEKQGSLFVNHPLTFDKLRFYQSSYGVAPEIKAIVTYTNAGKKGGLMTLAAGDTFDMPENKGRGFVLRVEENIMQTGPAIKLRIVSQKKDVQFWVFQHLDQIVAMNPNLLTKVPMFNPGIYQPLVFSLNRIEQTSYTGLHLVRDPGVPFVALGGLLMVAGLIVVFFIQYQRLWVFMKQEDAKISISIAGRSNRNNQHLQKKIDYLCRQINQELKA